MSDCIHNQRRRYTHGFYCKDCEVFFPKDSSTYRKDELLSSIWMVLWNINAELFRSGEPEDPNVKALADKIGIGIKHDDYEGLIAEAEPLMRAHSKTSESASLTLSG